MASRVMRLPAPETKMEQPPLRHAPSTGARSTSLAGSPLNSSGQPLNTETRAFFEPRFGRDFGDVRVHADEGAARSAQAVGAQAYTFGREIVFNENQYRPQTETGKSLLAHELAHV
ncbi:MAG: DUF4157 domain-containing protein, partial [Acidobacteria bacterium]|nr:DUF4157 domain-containing protein [Acidobacteriota bacterium]